jgi:hypothetical protein
MTFLRIPFRAQTWALMGFVAALCLFSPTAQAYKKVGFRWVSEGGPILFQLHSAGSDDISDGSDLKRIEEAFQAWSCAEGTNLRFVRGDDLDGPGSEGDGITSIYWIENESELAAYGLTDKNVAVTINNAIIETGAMVVNDETDIVLNGFHFTWNSEGSSRDGQIPIFPVLLSHIGSMLGFSQSCESAEDPACPGIDNTVLKYFYDYQAEGPLSDDVLALQDLYPADDDSSCNGPYRHGERCETNCDCLSDLICMTGAHGFPVCTPQCSSDDSNCPPSFTCLFGQKDEDGVAPGVCHQLGREELSPISSYCETNNQCTSNSCLAVGEVGRSICRQTCEDDGDCEGQYNYQCTEGVCLGPGQLSGIACPAEETGCACQERHGSNTSATGGLLLVLCAFLYPLFRRRINS